MGGWRDLRPVAVSSWAAGFGLACIFALAAPLAAHASFGINTWEAATCKTDINPPEPPNRAECTYASPETQFFSQVGGRANFEVAHFAFNTIRSTTFPDIFEVDGTPKDIRVDLPSGMTINPQAAGQCTEVVLESLTGQAQCEAAGAQLGSLFVVVTNGETVIRTLLPLFNIVPKAGEPAELGFTISVFQTIHITVFIDGTVDWAGDFHQGVTIHAPELVGELNIAEARLALDSSLGGNSLVSVGTDCHGSTTSTIAADSKEDPGDFLTKETTTTAGDHPIAPSGCERVPFEPAIAAAAGAATTDSPTSLAVSVNVPFEAAAPISQAHLKRAEVTLPQGMGLNPAAAAKLQACSDEQFPRHVAIGDPVSDPAGVHPPPIACPAASAIGTVTIDTPLLPDPLQGAVYLARQLSREPASGNEYRVFLEASSPRFGVYLRLVGQIAADPASGQLTATFDDPAEGGLPQVPFRSLELHLDGGGVLTTPPTCGTHALAARLFPWSGLAPARAMASFQLSGAPGPGPCPTSLAGRPFAPSFKATLDDPRAASFSPLRIQVERAEGQQELKGTDFALPAGITAKLAGVPYCPEAALAAAAGAAGGAERDNPSCPAASRLGAVAIGAGSGPAPIRIPGSAYLAGPYRGAPLSLAVVTPALAGPFDLGTSVVRVALFVDPASARIRAVSDPIPDVFGGAKLDIRSLSLDLDRREFALAGTSCDPAAATGGALRGGGANPADPASSTSFAVSAPLAVSGCKKLGFKPRLRLRLAGATKRTKHPKLKVSLTARPGDANLGRASLALPQALILDQRSLAGVCTRPQFAAEQCPAKSVYGTARAVSPLLDEPLEGKVYLRSSEHKLPDLVAHLEGQITVDLDGRIDNFKGGIRTSFGSLPDVPLSRFSLTIPGGRHGLLQASTDLCKAPVRALVRLAGQNGKKLGGRRTLKVRCGRR